jgi:hypothetical protein
MDRPDTHHDALEFPNGETDVDFGLGVSLADESHRPAIIASRPASMRLAIAISPSREHARSRGR